MDAGGLRARFVPPVAVGIEHDDRGAGRGKKAVALSTDRVAATALPEVLTVGYNSAERDYLIGAQRARRDSAARREMRVDLPVTLDASVAKQLAEARLKRIWAERSRATVTVPWRGLKIDAGNLITVPGLAGAWRVTRIVFEAMVLRLDLVLGEMVSVATPVADPGRNQAQTDRVHGPTTLRVLDLPQMGDVPVTTPALAVAANGASGGWRRASLLASLDGGLSWEPAGETAAPTIMGLTLSVLAVGPSVIADRANAIDVRLLHDGMTLFDADDAGLRAGSNLAAIGDEFIQFGRATPLGGRDWRLSELWRGRRGSEGAILPHAVGSSFTVLDPPALRQVDARFAVPGVKMMAVGVGDATGVIADAPSQIGRAVLPLSPVAFDATPTVSGFALTWIRRSRDGWIWRDGIDVPVAEQAENYRITKRAPERPDLIEALAAPLWTYANAELALDRAAGATQAMIDIRQVGTFGLSAPATLIISI